MGTSIIRNSEMPGANMGEDWVSQQAVADALKIHTERVGVAVRAGMAGGGVQIAGGHCNQFKVENIFCLLVCRALTSDFGLNRSETKQIATELLLRWKKYNSRHGAGAAALRETSLAIVQKRVDGFKVFSVSWGTGGFGKDDAVIILPLASYFDEAYKIFKGE